MVRINNLEWKVVTEPSIYTYLGSTLEGKLEIHIARVPSLQAVKRTIAHEVVHAYLYSYGFPRNKYSEEDLCEFIANNIEAILQISRQVFDELNLEVD